MTYRIRLDDDYWHGGGDGMDANRRTAWKTRDLGKAEKELARVTADCLALHAEQSKDRRRRPVLLTPGIVASGRQVQPLAAAIVDF
jgi:hypothetical protein